MKLTVDLKERSYDITIGKNLLSDADKYFNLDRNVLIVTDDNIPSEYSEKIKGCSKNGIIKVITNGEKSKSFEGHETLLKTMLDNGFPVKTALLRSAAELSETLQVLRRQHICVGLIFIMHLQPFFHRSILQ